MAEDRKSWIYAQVSPDERSALRRMAKAENKTVEKLCQDILYPAIEVELKAFSVKEEAALKQAAEEKAAADAAKAKLDAEMAAKAAAAPAAAAGAAPAPGVDPSQFAGAAKA